MSSKFQLISVFSILVASAACSGASATNPETDDALTADAGSTPTITFERDRSIAPRVSSPLLLGAKVRVRYSVLRRHCSVNGGFFANAQPSGKPSFAFTMINDNQRDPSGKLVGYLNGEFTVPSAGDIALWFEDTGIGTEDNSGCHGWDSNGGSNFRFPVASVSAPTKISFGADRATPPHQSVPLVVGSTVEVRYAVARRRCSPNGLFRANVSADGGDAVTYETTLEDRRDASGNLIGDIVGHFTVPNASHLALWFEDTGTGTEGNSGCHGWDSNGGSNYQFSIAPH